MSIVKRIESKRAFEKYEYCIFDSYLNKSIIQYMDEKGIDYNCLGVDFFKEKDKCPIFLNLRKIKDVDREFFENNYIEDFNYQNTNFFDQHSSINVFFNSILTEHEIIFWLLRLMRFNNKIFRFYDCRVLIFINIYIGGNCVKKNEWYQISKDDWLFSISGNYYKLKNEKICFNSKKINFRNLKVNEDNFEEVINFYHKVNLKNEDIFNE